MKAARKWLAITLAMVLTACGGGGGGGGGGPTGPAGFWQGTTSSGAFWFATVLPDQTLWAITASPGALGLMQGNINGTGHVYQTINGFTNGGSIPINMQTTAQPRSSISGNATGGTTFTFSGTYQNYFEQTPSLATAAGTYFGQGPTAGATFNFAANGTVNGTVGLCNFTGAATPRTDGNVLNITLNFTGPCTALPLTGIALYDQAGGLIVTTLDSTQTQGYVFLGSR